MGGDMIVFVSESTCLVYFKFQKWNKSNCKNKSAPKHVFPTLYPTHFRPGRREETFIVLCLVCFMQACSSVGFYLSYIKNTQIYSDNCLPGVFVRVIVQCLVKDYDIWHYLKSIETLPSCWESIVKNTKFHNLFKICSNTLIVMMKCNPLWNVHF